MHAATVPTLLAQFASRTAQSYTVARKVEVVECIRKECGLHLSTFQDFMRKGEKTPKRNLWNLSRQDLLNFVSTAWAAVSEKMVMRSFKWCGVSVALDNGEDGHLHSRLAGTGEPMV